MEEEKVGEEEDEKYKNVLNGNLPKEEEKVNLPKTNFFGFILLFLFIFYFSSFSFKSSFFLLFFF